MVHGEREIQKTALATGHNATVGRVERTTHFTFHLSPTRNIATHRPFMFSERQLRQCTLLFFLLLTSSCMIRTLALARPLSSVSMSSSSSSSSVKPKIAIIGSGASGLAASRAVQKANLNGNSIIEHVVYEQHPGPGGVWRYQTKPKTPMYRGLRTNLPKECMAYREWPFSDNVQESFVTHQEVQEYLESYRDHFNLNRSIRYSTRVENLDVNNDICSKLLPNCPTLSITITNSKGETETEIFDAVFCCNGHYDVPSTPVIPGLNKFFKGTTSHSKTYDNPDPWQGKTVLCIGGRASGSDIARELSSVCPHVYLSDSTCSKAETTNNVTSLPPTIKVDEDGNIHFKDTASTYKPDAIIFCTGYDYSFPFCIDSRFELESPDGDRRVSPLFEQLWHARYPNLAFIGIPHSVIPFPLFEIQTEAVLASWQQPELLFPDLEMRMEHANRTSGGEGKENGRVQDTHFLGDAQWEYCRRLAKIAGVLDQEVEEHLQVNRMLYEHAASKRKGGPAGGPDTYREFCYERNGSTMMSYPNKQAKQAALNLSPTQN